MSSWLRQPRVSIDCVRDALEWARQRLRGRPDSEHGMTPEPNGVHRVSDSVFVDRDFDGRCGGCRDTSSHLRGFHHLLHHVTNGYCPYSWKPQVSGRRRLCAMASDFGMISYAAAAGGIGTGFFYSFYLWTVFGNGFRFGVPYLYAAMIMANAGGVYDHYQ